MTCNDSDLRQRLERLAYARTIPFCYACYIDAPSGRCPNCDSDDLMRHRAGDGVEYGVDWVIPRLVTDSVDAVDTDELFEESMRDCYGETTKVGWMELDTVDVMKESDPIAWNIAKGEWLDGLVVDGALFTLDGEAPYYSPDDIRAFIDDAEDSLGGSSTPLACEEEAPRE